VRRRPLLAAPAPCLRSRSACAATSAPAARNQRETARPATVPQAPPQRERRVFAFEPLLLPNVRSSSTSPGSEQRGCLSRHAEQTIAGPRSVARAFSQSEARASLPGPPHRAIDSSRPSARRAGAWLDALPKWQHCSKPRQRAARIRENDSGRRCRAPKRRRALSDESAGKACRRFEPTAALAATSTARATTRAREKAAAPAEAAPARADTCGVAPSRAECGRFRPAEAQQRQLSAAGAKALTSQVFSAASLVIAGTHTARQESDVSQIWAAFASRRSRAAQVDRSTVAVRARVVVYKGEPSRRLGELA